MKEVMVKDLHHLGRKYFFSPHTCTILTENNMFDLGERNLRRRQNIKNTIQERH